MLRTYRVKNIFNIDKTLTRHLKDFWGIELPTFMDSASYWWVTFDCKKKGYLKDLENWVAYSGMRSHDTESCYFGPVFVKETVRGRGLQAKLNKKKMIFAQKLGYKRVISSTTTINYQSCNNLIKCGFKLYEGWFAEPSENSLYWYKNL